MALAVDSPVKKGKIDKQLVLAIANCFVVPDRMQLTEWSEKYRVLPQEEAKGGLYRVDNTPWNAEIMNRLDPDDPCTEVVFMKSTQIGALLDLNTPVLTSNRGWTTQGDLCVGDIVFDEKGMPCNVLGKSPVKENTTCYQITFSDGATVVCDESHLWTVNHISGNTREQMTLRTSELISRPAKTHGGNLTYKRGNRYRYSIPTANPIEYPWKELPIDPYILGVWLGNGNRTQGSFCHHTEDIAHHQRELSQAGYKPGKVTKDERGQSCYLGALGLKSDLRVNGLLFNKHIPKNYLMASASQRLALLQGLMDTDGSVSKASSRCEFTQSDTALFNQIVDLVYSLGFKPSICKRSPGKGMKGRVDYHVLSFVAYREFSPFRIARKCVRLRSVIDGRSSETFQRRIVDISPVESRPVQCIMVDSPNHLYLVGRELIPTHNTELGNNWLGQTMHQLKGRFLSVMPTAEMAKRNVRTRINQMIESTPELRSIVAKPNSREGANTLLEKEFEGGMFVSTGASSGTGMRSIAAQRVCGDEIEAWPPNVDGEGEPLEIIKRRMDSYGDDKKALWMSTPKDADSSRIEKLFNLSDRNRFYVPCPECGLSQHLVWRQVSWEDDTLPETARYICEGCDAKWDQAAKVQATRAGEWLPEREWRKGMPRGYHINAIYSHTVTLSELVTDWIAAQTHIERLITFINTRLGETWKDQSIYSYDPEALISRAETYSHPCPYGVQLITGGVDVQDNRLELECLGWGWEEECFSLGHWVIEGDTSDWEPWKELDKILMEGFEDPTGKLQYVSALAVDSGYQTNMVYNYCLKRVAGRTHRIWPIKGASDNHGPLWGKRPDRNTLKKLRPYMVNVYEIKRSFYARLNMTGNGPGRFHFSTMPWHNQEWVDQLTSETLVTRRVNRKIKKEWHVRQGVRNEVLDCVVYAFAAMKGMLKSGYRFKRLSPPALDSGRVLDSAGGDVAAISPAEPSNRESSVVRHGAATKGAAAVEESPKVIRRSIKNKRQRKVLRFKRSF